MNCESSSMSDPVMLVPVRAPVGWIALTQSELCAAQARAVEMLGTGLGSNRSPGERVAPCSRQLLTPNGAARALSVDASWLLRRAREGAIPHVRLGRYVRFDVAAIVGLCTKQPK
jgi:hypothetical protein